MLRPTNRLMLWLTAILPFAALGAIAPVTAPVSFLMFALFFVVSALDAAVSRSYVDYITLTLPEIVRMSIGRAGKITVTITRNNPGVRSVIIGLPFPEEIISENDTMNVALPVESGVSRVDWQCTPHARGNYIIEKCYFQVGSFCGLWDVRGATSCRMEVRVYPNLMTERRDLASIFLNRGTFGIHAQRMIGQGRDFEKLREYIPGDNFDEIHWKATAKRGRPITKLFQVERTQEIYVIIDTSRLSAKNAGNEPALEKFITSSLVLGLTTEKQGDLFGLITFDNKVRRFIKASGGSAHFGACREALYTLNSSITSPDFDELATFIRLRLRRRALLLFLTDLGDPLIADSFMRNIELLCHQHVVVVAMLQQDGVERLFSGGDGHTIDDLYRKLGGHMIWKNIFEVQRKLQHRGVSMSVVDNAKLSAEMVSQYMKIKMRQAL